jgi:nicotinate-nucleotide adenylyltransferase
MKIGLFFGSFNPIHIGHLIVAEVMATHTDLDKVCFVVSPHNPFKKNSQLLHEQDRYDLVARAVADNHRFQVSDIEFRLPKPSYTIRTLVELSERNPSHEYRLIMGGDNLEHFHKWKSHETILDDFGIYAYPRPGAGIGRYDDHPNITVVNAPNLRISASFIRKCLKEGKSIRYLVPESVLGMINSKEFYR